MKEWLRYFRIWFLVCGIILAVIIVYFLINFKETETVAAERVNKVCTETERVFDFADVLTDWEEDEIRKLIAIREKQTQCDIVLVVMNESLEEYSKGYFPDSYGIEWTMIKADNFYDEHGLDGTSMWKRTTVTVYFYLITGIVKVTDRYIHGFLLPV